jgi:hypothetical protein
MKNFIIISSLLFVSQFTYAQLLNNNFHVYGHFGGGGVGGTNYTANQGTSYLITGLRAEILFKKGIGLNYNFDYQMRRDSITQFHSTMGVVGAPFLMGFGIYKGFDGDSTTKGVGTFLLGLALLALPDGISMHYNPAPGWDVSPYANILGLDFIKDKRNDELYIKYACSFGVKGTYILKDRLTFTAYAETRQAASFGWGFGGGFGIGVVLGRKKTE